MSPDTTNRDTGAASMVAILCTLLTAFGGAFLAIIVVVGPQQRSDTAYLGTLGIVAGLVALLLLVALSAAKAAR